MKERSLSSTMLAYIPRTLGIAALLIVLSFLSAGFQIRNMSLPLAVWGILALIYGSWRLAMPESARFGTGALNAMRGQGGADPLANYTNRQEYKLAKLRDEEKTIEQGAGVVTEPERAAAGRARAAHNAACMTMAGVLLIALSVLAARVFPR